MSTRLVLTCKISILKRIRKPDALNECTNRGPKLISATHLEPKWSTVGEMFSLMACSMLFLSIFFFSFFQFLDGHSSYIEEDKSSQLQDKERERRKWMGSKIHQIKRELYNFACMNLTPDFPPQYAILMFLKHTYLFRKKNDVVMYWLSPLQTY